MGTEEIVRFNELSKKALKKTATQSELLEFKKLLLSWDNSIDFNFNGESDTPDPKQ